MRVPSSSSLSSARKTITLLPALLLLLAPFNNNLLTPSSLQLAAAADVSDEYFCGTSWGDAASNCHKHCPTGSDDECTNDETLGSEYGCFYFTGCTYVADAETELNSDGSDGDGDSDGGDEDEGNDASNNNFCGKTWIHAMLGCTESCPMGFECANSEDRCFAATNCDQPLEVLLADMVSTMVGPDTPMDDDDTDIFAGTIFDTIATVAEEMGIALGDVDVGDQTLIGRRQLQDRVDHRALLGHERYMHLNLRNVTQRMLPSGSSAIDVSMVVTGDYRPPPYVDLNVIAEDSINRNGAKVVDTLRERGQRAGRDYFNRVEGIEAVRAEEFTRRPTKAPIATPTVSPQGDPTSTPSGVPTTSPSDFPSSAPSRALDRVIMTGSREDLQIGGETTSSYGYVFNIRTKPDAPVALITGMDFYTLSTEDVNFELWTRLGSFKDFKGCYEGWDLIASGTVKGRGVGRYTSIPEELYTPVAIPGGGGEGGTRAFYITMNTINLVYKLGQDGSLSDTRAHHETDDIEIWEGEGVLFYPFPDPADTFFYRYPRQYLGAIYYNRLPCRPFSLYGPVTDLPCPLVPTGSPTLPPPTKSPVTAPPSVSPIIQPTKSPTLSPTKKPVWGMTPAPVEPTEFPTANPTISPAPTVTPTTREPTLSPIVPMRVNIITTLRNVPGRSMTDREIEKFLEILTTFLRRHTGSSMALEGIDIWHQQLVMVDAKEGYVAPVKDDATAEDEEEDASDPQVARGALDNNGRRILQQRKKKPEPIPQVTAMDVTLTLRISVSNLPINLLGNNANVAIAEHEQELLDLLHEQQAFYTFFREMDGVIGRTLEGDLTNPPSASPTTEAYKLAKEAELEALANMGEEEEEDSGMGFGVFVGLGVGFLWCCLTGISVAYLLSARGEMEEQRDMENLLKAEKANPIDGGGGDDTASVKSGKSSKLRRSSTVPMGNDDSDRPDGDLEHTDSDDSDFFDHTKNKGLKSSARIELTKSVKMKQDGEAMSELRKFADSADGQNNNTQSFNQYAPKSKRHQGAGMAGKSMVVTSTTSKAMMLEKELDEIDADRRKSAPDVARRKSGDLAGSKSKKFAQSAVVPKSELDDLEKSLAKNDAQVLKRSGTNGGGAQQGRRALASSMVAPKTSSSELRRSARKGSSDNLQSIGSSHNSSMKRSGSSNNLSMKRSGSSNNLSMRRSTRHHGSSDNLAGLKQSGNKGRSDHSSSMRRSTKHHGSSDNLAGLKRSTNNGAGGADDLRKSTTARKRGGTGDNVLRNSDLEVRKPNRKGSGSLAKSMIT